MLTDVTLGARRPSPSDRPAIGIRLPLSPLLALLLTAACSAVPDAPAPAPTWEGRSPAPAPTAEAGSLEFAPLTLPPALDDTDEATRGRSISAILPTAKAQHVDLRARWFSLSDGRAKLRAEVEGSTMLGEDVRISSRLRGDRTDASGDGTKSSLEQYRFRALSLIDHDEGDDVDFGIGFEWDKDLGDYDDGTGSGSDRIAPIVSTRVHYGEHDSVTFMGRYFYSYREDRGVKETRQLQARAIWLHQFEERHSWIKSDVKVNFDQANKNDRSSTLDIQFGRLLTKHLGLYVDIFLGNDVFEASSFDHGFGVGTRWVF